MTNNRPFTLIAAFIFAIVAIAHLCRLVVGWPVVIGGHELGMVPSLVGMLIAGLLAIMLYRESRR